MLNDYNSKVTLELRDLVESGINIWDFDYPDFHGDKKQEFEQKVIDHYYLRQIGQETPGRWLHYFRTRIKEIMPYYCQLHKIQSLFEAEENVLESYNLVETFEQDTSGRSESTSTSQSSSTGTADQRFHDTPQGRIENLDNYLTTATRNNSESSDNGSGTSEGESSGKTTHTLTRKGNIGVQTMGEEITKNRNAIINIDMMIIEELSDLFLGIY